MPCGRDRATVEVEAQDMRAGGIARWRPRRALLVCVALMGGLTAACSGSGPPVEPSATAEVLTVTPSTMAWVDAISTDAQWLVGTQPRESGASAPNPLVRMDRRTGQQTVLCDWADPDLGYCSLAEQGGMVPESPNLLLELADDNAVRGWFPSGGVYLTDSSTGVRTRVDVDAQGTPLTPAWSALPCGGQCDYHQVPRLHISTDSISADGAMAAFCVNYDAPRQPQLYVKDLRAGTLTRTGVRCGIDRFGPEDDDDEFNDEAMTTPRISADGSLVHLSGDRSTIPEHGVLGWQPDTLYSPSTGQVRTVPGSGSMTRDGRTLFLRSGTQPDAPEAEVDVQYVAYDVATGTETALPWMAQFLGPQPGSVLDMTQGASDDGRVLVSATAVREVASGVEVDIGSLLREQGLRPTIEGGGLRISGDGSTIIADVIEGDPRAEANNAVVLVTGWGWQPMARATLTPVAEQTALKVDVDPDGAGPWLLEVQRTTEDTVAASTWEPLPEQYSTEGAGNTVTIDLPTGVYRVRIPAQHGYRGFISAGEWIAPEAADEAASDPTAAPIVVGGLAMGPAGPGAPAPDGPG